MKSPTAEIPQFERVIRHKRGLATFNFAELWRYRELFVFLSWRDILVRYKQTYLGIGWAVLQPVLTMVVFTILFGGLGKFPRHDAPYPVLTFAALLPWYFFSNALSQSSNSLVASANMISKIYFPRLIIPASAVLSGLVDFLIGCAILAVLMPIYGVAFRLHLLLLPAFLLVAFLAALAMGVWLSALNVKYRDVKYIVPFFTSMGLLASPVGFLSTIIPEHWRFWYSLNPMVGVIDGFRWCVLGPNFEPYWPGFVTSCCMIAILLATGLVYFRTTEKTFADLI
jgi:lipopolysaccharide transport system permease protein